MIWAFNWPHAIGSVCRWPCPQCGDDVDHPELSSAFAKAADGDIKQFIALFIVRKATRKEYVKFVREQGEYPRRNRGYYYEVTSD